MSTVRNSIPSRSYRERPQPLSRAHKYPLLEKHKDYSKRARDHNAKQRKLKSLREKAASRNEDEFSFGMMSSRSEGGRLVSERKRANKSGMSGDGIKGVSEEEVAKGLRNETARRLKGQDLAWVRNERSKVQKMVRRAQETVRFNGSGTVDLAMTRPEDESSGRKRKRRGPKVPKHTVFVDDEAQQQSFDPATHFNTTNAGVARAWNRPRKGEPDSSSQRPATAAQTTSPTTKAKTKQSSTTPAPKNPAKSHAKLQAFLGKLKQREEELGAEEVDLERQRAGMRKNQAGMRGESRDGTKWKVPGRAK